MCVCCGLFESRHKTFEELLLSIVSHIGAQESYFELRGSETFKAIVVPDFVTKRLSAQVNSQFSFEESLITDCTKHRLRCAFGDSDKSTTTNLVPHEPVFKETHSLQQIVTIF